MRVVTLAVITALASIVFLLSTPIQQSIAAGAGAVEVSRDGVAFSPTWSGTLFDNPGVMVPGDTRSELFHVRNSSAQPGFLRITLVEVVSSNAALADALTLSASAAGVSGVPVAVSKADPCWVLLEGPVLAPGDAEAVTAGLALGDLDGLAGRDGRVTLAIRVSLIDTSAGALPPSGCDVAGTDVALLSDSQPLALATTGADLPVPAIALGGTLFGVGLFLFRSTRRLGEAIRDQPSSTGAGAAPSRVRR